MVGSSVPAEDEIDGIDQSDMVLRGAPSNRNQMIYFIDREKHLGQPEFGEMAIRNERYKLIWGMPGYSDGYDMDTGHFFDLPYYIDRVENSTPRNKRRVKRGGRPVLSEEQQRVLEEYISLVEVTPEQFEAGTGSKLLFDLLEDPSETNDLSQSSEHQEVVDELTRALQDAVAAKYVGITPESQVIDLRSLPQNHGGAIGIGWCEDTLPLPGEEKEKEKEKDKGKDKGTSAAVITSPLQTLVLLASLLLLLL